MPDDSLKGVVEGKPFGTIEGKNWTFRDLVGASLEATGMDARRAAKITDKIDLGTFGRIFLDPIVSGAQDLGGFLQEGKGNPAEIAADLGMAAAGGSAIVPRPGLGTFGGGKIVELKNIFKRKGMTDKEKFGDAVAKQTGDIAPVKRIEGELEKTAGVVKNLDIYTSQNADAREMLKAAGLLNERFVGALTEPEVKALNQVASKFFDSKNLAYSFPKAKELRNTVFGIVGRGKDILDLTPDMANKVTFDELVTANKLHVRRSKDGLRLADNKGRILSDVFEDPKDLWRFTIEKFKK